MTTGHVQALDRLVRLEVDPPADDGVLGLLADLSVAPDRGPDLGLVLRQAPVGWVLTGADERLIATDPAWEPLAETALALLNATAADRETFTAHAAVLAGPGGVAVVPGISGAGKTTLCAAALAAGLTYVTDEAAAFVAGGRLVAYPRPLGIDRAATDLLGLPEPRLTGPIDCWFRAGELGSVAAVGSEHAPTHLVLPSRRPGDVRLAAGEPATAAAALLRMGFNHFKDPSAAFETAAACARGTEVVLLEYGDARDAAAELARLLGC